MGALNIGIFYFSGTGNTKIVAELYCEEFKKHSANVDLIAIEDILKKKIPLSIKKYDLIGLGHPVHAFSAPKIVFDFLGGLPFVRNKKTFTFKTSGDPLGNGGATTLVRKNLNRKGYMVFNENLIVMPANVIIMYDDVLVKQLYNTAIRKVKKNTIELLSGKVKLQKNNVFLRIGTFFFNKMESMGTKSLGSYFKTSNSCNLCEICLKNCPTDNIFKENDKIQFGKKCTFCMRCIYNCPKMAISIRYFNFFILKGGYNIQKIINNPSIKGNYITSRTKGYFKHYYPYIIGD